MTTFIAHRYLFNELGILHRDISLNNILLRRVADADEAVGLLIDYDYAELLLLDLEGLPESSSDAAAMDSGSETLDEQNESNIKTFRTVSFLFNLLNWTDWPLEPGHSTLHVHRSTYHRRSEFHSSSTAWPRINSICHLLHLYLYKGAWHTAHNFRSYWESSSSQMVLSWRTQRYWPSQNSSYEQSWIHDYKLLHELLGWFYSLCNAIGFCLLSSQDNPTKSAHSQDHARNTTWSVFSSRGDIWPGYRCKETTASGRSLCTYEAGEACQRKSGIGMDTAEDGYRRGWSGWGWSDVYLSIFSLYYCSPSFNLFVWTHTSFHESSVFVILVTVSVCFFSVAIK